MKTLLFFCSVLLLVQCSVSSKDQDDSTGKPAQSDLALLSALEQYPDFQRASFFWSGEGRNSDSAVMYYSRLLEENLQADLKILIINRLGYLEYLRRNFRESMGLFNRAVSLVDQVSEEYSDKTGYALYSVGRLHSESNRPDSALIYWRRADTVFRNHPARDPNYHFQTLYLSGEEYLRKIQDYTSAEKYFRMAMELAENHEITDRKANLFRLRYNLASTFREKKELDQALSFAREALFLADSLGEAGLIEESLSLISNIHRDRKEWILADSLNRRAIGMNLASDANLINRAAYLNNQAFILINLKQYDEAWENCRAAVATLRDVPQAKETEILEEMAISYDFMATQRMMTDRHDEALNYYLECLKIRRIRYGNFHKRVAQVCNLIGNLYLKAEEPDRALEWYQESLITGSREFEDQDPMNNPALWQVLDNVETVGFLQNKAQALQALGKRGLSQKVMLEASLQCYKLCDSLISYVWGSYTNEAGRLILENFVHPVYQEAIETAYQLYELDPSGGYQEEIHRFMEMSRNRLLSDNLTGLSAYSRAKIPPALVASLREKEALIGYYNRRIREQPENIEALNKMLLNKTREKESLTDSMDRAYPQLAAIKQMLTAVSPDSTHNKIKGRQELLVRFFNGTDYFYFLSSDGNKTGVFRERKDSALMAGLDILGNIHATDLLDPAVYKNLTSAAHLVYNRLLKPCLDFHGSGAAAPEKPNRIVIIPDGPLSRIPFEALISSLPGQTAVDYRIPEYLLRNFEIRYAFSWRTAYPESGRNEPDFTPKVLGIGFGSSGRTASSQTDGLVWTGRELDSVRAQADGLFLKNRKATESAFKRLAPAYRILHLALHGRSDTTGADRTMLIFRKKKHSGDDGYLMPEELYSMNLSSELVFLSSCETGIGKEFRGEGMYSMARAFALTGCPAMVATLWPIPDRQAAGLVSGFYRGLKQNLTPGEALRKSKIDYLRESDPVTAHPLFWASFILIGETSSMLAR